MSIHIITHIMRKVKCFWVVFFVDFDKKRWKKAVKKEMRKTLQVVLCDCLLFFGGCGIILFNERKA